MCLEKNASAGHMETFGLRIEKKMFQVTMCHCSNVVCGEKNDNNGKLRFRDR